MSIRGQTPRRPTGDGAGPGPSRLGLRQRLLASGLIGVAMTGLVAQSALSGLGHVHRSDEALSLIRKAQRLQQDADMMHDALRADVYHAVLIGSEADQDRVARSAREVRDDAGRLRRDLDQIAGLHLTGKAALALAPLPARLRLYSDEAVRLTMTELTRPPAQQRDPVAFTQLFESLKRLQSKVTADLGDVADSTKADADNAATAAQRQILVASTVALAVLLLLAGMLNRMGARLARLVARQRGVAETLQESLLPDRLPDLPGLALAARYVPRGIGIEVGGDWYDVLPLASGEIGLVMGDVVGHDLHAASVMGQMRNALLAYALEGLSPGPALGRLNQFVRQIDSGEDADPPLATCVFALFHPQASTLLVANAGHYPPLVLGPDREPMFLDYGGCPPIGGLEAASFVERLYHLRPGSTVLLYTDGLIERRGEEANAGMARLLAAAADGPADVDALCEHILARLLADGTPADDVALLALNAQAQLGPELNLTVRAVPTELGPLRRTLTRWLEEAMASPDEVFELTVAVGEAATNAIEHAYGPDRATFDVAARLAGQEVQLSVTDRGHWRLPRGRDRGRGLEVIEEFTDSMNVETTGSGTTVRMYRQLGLAPADPVPVDDMWHTTGAG